MAYCGSCIKINYYLLIVIKLASFEENLFPMGLNTSQTNHTVTTCQSAETRALSSLVQSQLLQVKDGILGDIGDSLDNGRDALCQKIYANNKRVSQERKGLQLKQSRSMNLAYRDGDQKWQKQKQKSGSIDASSKLKYFQSNKKMIESSIEATICVERALNALCHREILQNHEYKYLNAKNMRTLENKQKRYKNLELREHKARLALSGGLQDHFPKECRQDKQNSLPRIGKPKHKTNMVASGTFQ